MAPSACFRRAFAAAFACLIAIAGLVVQTPVAQADDRPVSTTTDYSPYEKESIRDAIAAVRGKVEPAPEGKILERVEVVSTDVIEKRDPAPAFLNVFHTRTRSYVIEREALLDLGDRYVQVLVDETARNLRRFHQLSLVACVPLQGSRPDRVRLLIVTKDVWSLRLNSDFRFAGGALEYLLLQPSEENLAGTHHTVSALLTLQPLSYSLGGRYVIPRLLGSRVMVGAEASVIQNRETGSSEGSFGTLSVGQPLYSTLTEWSWDITGSWLSEVTRRYVNGKLGVFDARSTVQPDNIPFEYGSRVLALVPSVTRSFGWGAKHDFTVGVDASRRVYRTFDLSAYGPVAVSAFQEQVVPVSDTKVGPFVQVRAYRTDYLRVLDFETLGLQEDFRLGHDLYVRAAPYPEAFGSSRNVLGVYAGAQYTVALGDGLARVGVESATEHEGEQVVDGLVRVSTRLTTPRLGFGRIVFDTLVLNRYRNYLNRTSFLGGDTRLRGYPTRYFFGKDVVAYNLEFRTRPIEILTCQLGAAFFFDAGDAFDGFSKMRIKKSVGFGIRGLFPQLDRAALRVDVGFPLNPVDITSRAYPFEIVATFSQAFPVPSITPRVSTMP